MNNLDIIKGTTEYIDFLVDFLMNEFTHDLNKYENADAIKVYAVSYILAAQNQEIKYDGKDLIEIPESIAGKTIGQLKIEQDIREHAENQNDYIVDDSRISAISSTYSVSKVVSYAKKYANSRNGSFRSFSADCANFASQAINAGGKNMTIPSNLASKPLIYSTNNYWYNKFIEIGAGTAYRKEPRNSTAWSTVDGLYTYWKNRNATIIACSSMNELQNNVKLGDIVQLKSSQGWYHTIIITGGTKGNWKYCAHTRDRSDEPLKTATSLSYRIIRIK